MSHLVEVADGGVPRIFKVQCTPQEPCLRHQDQSGSPEAEAEHVSANARRRARKERFRSQYGNRGLRGHSFKDVHITFNRGAAMVVHTRGHSGCCQTGRLCFAAKYRLATAATQKMKCPGLDCTSVRSMEFNFLSREETKNPYNGTAGPDLVRHYCRAESGGCGAEYGAWEFVHNGEEVVTVLVRKSPWSPNEKP